MTKYAWVLALSVLVGIVGCGGEEMADDDVGPGDEVDAAPEMGECGNGVVEEGEECDDGNNTDDDTCRNDCQLTCGDGDLDPAEECDTAIPAGEEGACPTECDDGNACTQDALDGAGCSTTCVNAPITAPADGDGCCPDGADATTDSDCDAICGNGAVEEGELCDTDIAAGEPGACPTECDDMQACTADTLFDAGTCQAMCTNETITEAIDGDGCCPAGATVETDSDCSAGCGDGVVTSPETCDTAIPAGEDGACPTSCDDGMACTTDTLLSEGTCSATCSTTEITMPQNGDGCCPDGANANNDDDCEPVCGNEVVEDGEECDDGNTDAGDGCDDACLLEPIAFRISDLDLRDPHVYVDFLGCQDVTDQELFGFAVNSELQTAIQTDDDDDGLLDLSLVLRFDPLSPTTPETGLEFIEAECTAPMSSTTCTPDPEGTTVTSTANNDLDPTMPATCLEPLAGTLKDPPYDPAPQTPPGPCFVSDAETITVSLSGIPVVLSDARIAAQYVGSPPSTLASGLIRGFISEEDADDTILPDDLALVGGSPLSSILPGGTNNCASHDDRDTGPGDVTGWYFYLNFNAVVVPYDEAAASMISPVRAAEGTILPVRR